MYKMNCLDYAIQLGQVQHINIVGMVLSLRAHSGQCKKRIDLASNFQRHRLKSGIIIIIVVDFVVISCCSFLLLLSQPLPGNIGLQDLRRQLRVQSVLVHRHQQLDLRVRWQLLLLILLIPSTTSFHRRILTRTSHSICSVRNTR